MAYAAPAVAYAAPAVAPAVPAAPAQVPQAIPAQPKPVPSKVAVPADKATVVVRLPKDAKLWVDEVSCPLTSDVRSFNTPALKTGRKYFYTLKAEVVRDGKPVTEARRVLVAAGKRVDVDFGDMETVTTVKVPKAPVTTVKR